MLVVEDSDSFRFGLCSMLHRQMFKVVDVSSAEAALKLVNERDDIRVVLVDYLLPGMDGVELTRLLRTSFTKKELAIVGISVADDAMLAARFIKSGANDFVPKPFGVEEFHYRVNHTVEIMDTFSDLQEANEIKDRFLSMAVHDLRSPINGINGLSEMLLSGMCGELNNEQKEMIGYIHEANFHMNSMVGDLLDISVINTGRMELRMENKNLKNTIERRMVVHAITAKKKSISINLDLRDVGTFNYDPERVGQVLDNLMTNAVKFSPHNGFIDVTLELDGENAKVGVIDHGQGVPPGEEILLFQSFKKTSVRPTAGESSVGLGLPIVQSVVEAHGGTVWVESVYGKGASFYFTLPLKA